MAIIEVNFISKCLMRVVTFNAIIPVDKFGPQAENAEQKPLKTLYLLHGIFGNYTDWVNGTRIQAWAEANDLAVIMPPVKTASTSTTKRAASCTASSSVRSL